jgi:predicted ATP-dependent serine protease
VVVDAIDWYWSELQVVKLAQVRSLVGVAMTASYWLAEHVVSAAQVRSDEDVAGTVSNCHWVQTVKAWQGSVIDTRYWPTGQP